MRVTVWIKKEFFTWRSMLWLVNEDWRLENNVLHGYRTETKSKDWRK
jgi:hypothetical protein